MLFGLLCVPQTMMFLELTLKPSGLTEIVHGVEVALSACDGIPSRLDTTLRWKKNKENNQFLEMFTKSKKFSHARDRTGNRSGIYACRSNQIN
jgi:hypothetical protein